MSNDSHIVLVPLEFTKSVDMVYGTILLLIVLLGVPCNALSLFYFLAKRRDISSIIYSCITAVDTLLCLSALPPSLSYYNDRQPVLFASRVFCNSWIVVYKLLSALSIFCVALLSITRTYFLLKPFKSISQRLIVGVLVSYFLLLSVASTIMFWEGGGHFKYLNVFADCSYGAPGFRKYETISDVISKMCYTFPIFPILLSCIISCVALMKDNKRVTAVQGDEKHYASITIVMFTVLYAVFSIPASLINLIKFNKPLSKQLLAFDTLGYFENFVFSLSIPLNSLCNPVLYIIRMQRLRRTLVRKLTGKGNAPPGYCLDRVTEMVRVTDNSSPMCIVKRCTSTNSSPMAKRCSPVAKRCSPMAKRCSPMAKRC